jgi:uncharacterized protein YcaQ
MKLTRAEARRYLSHLHFERPMTATTPAGKVAEHVARRGCIQYDPLDVVGRNADLTLQSRIPSYKPEHLLKALYEDRTLLDGFDKNLAIYPVSDFPYFARARQEGSGWYYPKDEAVQNSYEHVLREVSERGPLCSDDLPLNEKVDWPWGPTKLGRAALESLWMRGDLVLHHRSGARRYFDLIGKYIPGEVLAAEDPNPREEDYHAWQMFRRIGSVGFLPDGPSDALLGASMKAGERQAALQRLLSEGKIVEAQVEDLKKPVYLRTCDLPILESALSSEPDGRMRVIAPLDNFIWDRRLIEALYGFQYRWEVYVPAPQRKYGYYVLPVYHRDEFVARFEPAHFRGGKFQIAHWWWERKPDRNMRAAQRACLKDFCRYLGADGYEILEESLNSFV